MRESDFQEDEDPIKLLKKRVAAEVQENDALAERLKKRIAVEEWDFSKVLREEQEACCYYEYARESKWLMKEIDNPVEVIRRGPVTVERTPAKEEATRKEKLRQSILVQALPPYRHVVDGKPVGRQKIFDGRPWLSQEPEWRRELCQNIEKQKDRLGFARILKKTPDRAFCVGIALPFPWRRWEEEHENRVLDRDTGLEAILVTIDWADFKDSEIIEQFRTWLKSEQGRPRDVGLRTMQGKRSDAWSKKLERLTLLRLRHHYSFEDMDHVIPEAWKKEKFKDSFEMERERRAARQAFFELFPFLPADAEPLHWSAI